MLLKHATHSFLFLKQIQTINLIHSFVHFRMILLLRMSIYENKIDFNQFLHLLCDFSNKKEKYLFCRKYNCCPPSQAKIIESSNESCDIARDTIENSD